MTADDLLREARTMISDMDNGWPTKELHRPPTDLIDEITMHLDDAQQWNQEYDPDD